MSSKKQTTGKTIVIIIPPKAQALDITGPMDAFLEANSLLETHQQYQVHLASATEEKQIRIAGMTIVADSSINELPSDIDTLLVAGSADYQQALTMPWLQQCLQQQATQVRRYGSICTGAFFLGAAGLLLNRKVTTHWCQADELAKSFPDAQVIPDAIYIQDGRLYTSAGISAGIDLALKLIEDDHGRDISLAVARKLVVFLRRPGGQSQFSSHLAAQMASEDRIQALQQWIVENVESDLSLKALSHQMGTSVRNLGRLFIKETGQTPGDFVEKARIDAARRLLEDNHIALQTVAQRCGFSSTDIMRRTFLRRIQISPNDYRKQFRNYEM